LPEPLGKKSGAGAALEKNQEPEPLGKKIGSRSCLKKKSGAGAATKFAGSRALVLMYILGTSDFDHFLMKY